VGPIAWISVLAGGTPTPNHGWPPWLSAQPRVGSTNWGTDVNANFQKPQNILANVVQTVDVVDRASASTAWVDTGIAVTFPLPLNATTSKVLIRVSLNCTASSISTVRLTLFRGAIELTPAGRDCLALHAIPVAHYNMNVAFEFLDAPGAIAAQPYKLNWKEDSATGYLGSDGTLGYRVPTIRTAQEIPA
jgi:hypothetical protein